MILRHVAVNRHEETNTDKRNDALKKTTMLFSCA